MRGIRGIRTDGRMPEPGKPRIIGLVYACCLLSGAAALTYEVVWNRELLTVFGSTTYATAAILAAFLGGMALGAGLAAQVVHRIARPLLAYALVELTVATYALAFGPLLAGLAVPYARLWASLGATPGSLLSGPLVMGGVLLLVPMVALGATLPLLGESLERSGCAGSRFAGRLYGFNTVGAAAGALGAGFLLLPWLGMGGATAVAIGLNVAAAVLALRAAALSREALAEAPPVPAPRLVPTGAAEPKLASPRRRIGLLAAVVLCSSVAALAYEVVWTRILVLIVGSSTYAFSLTTGVYIAGLALGSFWIASRVERLRRPGEVLAHLLLAVGFASLAGLYLVGRLPELFLQGFTWLGGSPGLWLFRVLLAGLALLPATFFLGAVFPVAVHLAGGRERRLGRPLGRVYAWMAAGNVAGVLLAATVLVPAAGLQGGMGALAVLSLVAGGLALWVEPLGFRTRAVTLAAAAAGALALWTLRPGWDPIVMTSGVYKDAPLYLRLAGSPDGLRRVLDAYRLVFYREGVQSVVSVVERPTLGRGRYLALAVDGKVDASTGADMSTQVLSGHLPLLVHPAPREVLVVGLASGVTVGSVARHPVDSVHVVEIEPAMPAAARAFGAFNHRVLADPRVRLVLDDGRHFLAVTRRRFDVIISEPSNPWMSGPARLFTREFFELARARLAPGGLLAQWVPLYGLEPEHLRVLLRTFLTVYPHALAFQVSTGDLLLLGSTVPLRIAPERFVDRISDEHALRDLARVGVHSAAELMAAWIGGERELALLAGAGPFNTDRNGFIEFRAPHALHANTLPGNTELLAEVVADTEILPYLELPARLDALASLLAEAGVAALEGGHPKRAMMWARAALGTGDTASRDYLLGRLALADGERSVARERWTQAQRSRPHPSSLLALARLETERGAFGPALRLLARIPPGARSAQADYLEGVARLGLSDPSGALRALQRIRPSAPESAVALLAPYLRSVAAERLGNARLADAERARFGDALRRLRRDLEREERQADLDRLLSETESLARGALDSAVVNPLRTSLRVAVLDPLAPYYRGVSLLWIGRAGDARAALEQAVRALDPTDPGAMSHFFLALAYLELGQQAAAAPHLRAFLDARGAEAADWAVRRARRLAARPVVAADAGAPAGDDG